VAGATSAQIAELGATVRFCANSTVNWIQFLRSFSQTPCHATDEVSRIARHSSQGVVVNGSYGPLDLNVPSRRGRRRLDVAGVRRTAPSIEAGSCGH
jgi:hypothetical protein